MPAPEVNAKELLFNFLEVLPVLVEYEKAKAKITREKYLALIRTGFTEQQALVLCKE